MKWKLGLNNAYRMSRLVDCVTHRQERLNLLVHISDHIGTSRSLWFLELIVRAMEDRMDRNMQYEMETRIEQCL